MSGSIRQQLPHVIKRLTTAIDNAEARPLVSVKGLTDAEEIADILLVAEAEKLKDVNQIETALKALRDLDADWVRYIRSITVETVRIDEESKYAEKRFTGENAYEPLIHRAETTVVQVSADKCFIGEKRKLHTDARPSAFATATTAASTIDVKFAPVQLPVLPIPKFDGNLRNWISFWEQFDVINSHPKLSNIQKLQYLKMHITSSAAALISNISLSDANYAVAVNILKEKYGKPSKYVETLWEDFRLTSSPTDNKLSGVRALFDKLEGLLQQLKAVGEVIDDTNTLVNWKSKFPVWIKRKVNPNLADNANFQKLREEYNRQITLEEELNLEFNFVKPKATNVHALSPPRNDARRAKVFEQKAVPRSCFFCNGNHKSHHCEVYRTLDEKLKYVQRKNRCTSCLRESSKDHRCKIRQCFLCKEKNHHPLLCDGKKKQFHQPRTGEKNVNALPSQPDTTKIASVVTSTSEPKYKHHNELELTTVTSKLTVPKKRVLLPTKKVQAVNIMKNICIETLLFFDCGSHQTFVLNKFAVNLKLKLLGSTTLPVRRFQDGDCVQVSVKIYKFHIKLINSELLEIFAYGVDDMVDALTCITDAKKRLVECQLPDILLGSDYYYDIFPCETDTDGLRYSNTLVGEVYGGPIPDDYCFEREPACAANVILPDAPNIHSTNKDDALNEKLNFFFSVESHGIPAETNETEAEIVERKFAENVHIVDKRIHVSLPFRSETPDLPLNYNFCVRSLHRLVDRLKRNGFLEQYDALHKLYMELGHTEVSPSGPLAMPDVIKTFLTQREVLKPLSKTTPIRPVFNCSFKASKNAYSLNQLLYSGPNMIPGLPGIIIRFREYLIVCIGDIEKAFYALRLIRSNRDAVSFLWVKDITKPLTPDNILHLRHCAPLFGATCSPFLLMASLRWWFELINTALAMELLKNTFVDNMNWGGSTSQEVIEKAKMAIDYLQQVSMNLQELMSNDSEVNEALGVTAQIVKFLGIIWNAISDQIGVECGIPKKLDIHPTKRIVVSHAAGIYDPIGLISPVVIQFKIFIQQLWIANRDWDDELNDEEKALWEKMVTENAGQKYFTSRCVTLKDAIRSSLHVFADASGRAYCAVAYLRQEDAVGEIKVSFLISKTRVAPIKPTSIPKKELLGTVLAAELIMLCKTEMATSLDHITLHTDSSCVLQWLYDHAALKPKFLAKCIQKVQNATKDVRHVRTHDNPADLGSRGCNFAELETNPLWKEGPPWLKEPEEKWPTPAVLPVSKAESEDDFESDIYIPKQQIGIPVNATSVDSNLVKDDIVNYADYSTWSKLIWVVTFILVFIKKISVTGRGKFASSIPETLSRVRSFAEKFILLRIQRKFAPSPQLSSQLNIKKGKDGLLRVLHRMENANPHGLIYLPHCHVTELIVLYYHRKYLHAGVKQTLNEIRRTYWICQGKSYCDRVLRKVCFECRKTHLSQPFASRPMPSLPSSRVQMHRPFEHIGIDMAGAFHVKRNNGEVVKAWILLFTCLTIRAVHLEVIYSPDAPSFLNGFRRFVAARGVPASILTDNGTNFIAAKPVITKEWIRVNRDLKDYFKLQRIIWDFITQKAPWKGGVFERLIALVKSCLKRCIGRRILSDDAFITLIKEIEAVLNNRPITPVDSKLENFDTLALTPNDFLLPHGTTSTPSFDDDVHDPEFVLHDTTQTQLLALWKKSHSLLKKFTEQWSTEYLHMLRDTAAHAHRGNGIQRSPIPGEVVLIADEEARENWRLAVVSEVHKSEDNEIRSATVKNSKGNFLKRPVNLLHPLEIQAADVPKNVLKVTDDNSTTANPTRSRRLQPKRAAKAFYILAIFALFCTAQANPCPADIETNSKATLVNAEYCKSEGLFVYEVAGVKCWHKIVCKEGHIRDSFHSKNGHCGTKCQCEDWADHCSFYEGPATKNSTMHNSHTRRLIDAAIPSDVTHANVIQLYDNSRHPVSSLSLAYQQLIADEITCFGEGNVTGTVEYCSQHECSANATRFCKYQTHEVVYWIFNGQKLSIKAWGTEILSNASSWSPKASLLQVDCQEYILQVKADKAIDILELSTLDAYHAERVFSKATNISIPPEVVTIHPALSVKVLYADDTEETVAAYCPPENFCSVIACYFCWDELVNPDCKPWKYAIIAAVALAISWALLLMIILYCCCYRRRNSDSFYFFSWGGWPPRPRKRKLSDSGSILVQYHKDALFCILIFCVILTPTQASEVIAITASDSQCSANAQGWLDCTFKEATQLWLNPNVDAKLLLKDKDDRPFATVLINAIVQSSCIPEEEFYTRIYKAEVSSSKRCRGAGPCSGMICSSTTADDQIEGLGVSNKYPGTTSCVESCGCWGCGCFICDSACLFYRYYAMPVTHDCIRIYSCSVLTPMAILNVTTITQQSQESKLIVLKDGESASTKNMIVTLLDVHDPISTNKLHIMETDQRYALLDSFGIAAANLLKCDSREDAINDVKSCKLQDQSCHCHPADDVASCTCQDNQVLSQILKERSLPYRLPQGWLRKSENGVAINQEAKIQLKITIDNLKLTTIVDRNRCSAKLAAVNGCANCAGGATLNITCSTDFGTAMAHVSCSSFRFALRCTKNGESQVVRVFTTLTKLDEECSIQCPAHTSKMTLHGTLWNTPKDTSWSHKKGEKNEADLQLEKLWAIFVNFISESYVRLVFILMLAVILLLVVKRLLLG